MQEVILFKESLMIIFVAGDKGRVGKSFIANCLIYYLNRYRKKMVSIIDADQANSDVFKAYYEKSESLVGDSLNLED